MINHEYYRLIIKIFHAMQHNKTCVQTHHHKKIKNILNILLDTGVILSYHSNRNLYYILFKNKYKFMLSRPISVQNHKIWYQLQHEQKNNFGTIYIYYDGKQLTLKSQNQTYLILKIIRLLVFKLKNSTTYIFKNGLEDWMVLFFYADFFNYIWIPVLYTYYLLLLMVMFG